MSAPVIDPAGSPIAGTESAAQGADVAAGIYRCFVYEVNAETWTLNARTEGNPHATFLDVPFGMLYGHQAMGEGIYYMPEPGSTCYIAQPSDGHHAVVLCFVMVEEDGSYRGGRPDLNPGDYAFMGRDGNFIFIRRGGILQIGSTALSQLVFLPIRNMIQGIFENLDLMGVPGDLRWEVARAEEDGGGHKRCSLTLNAREYADDPKDKPLISLKLGSLGDGVPTILSIETRDSGGGTVKTALAIKKDGSIAWTLGALNFRTAGVDWEVDGPVSVSATGPMALSSETSLALTAPEVALSAGAGTMGLKEVNGRTQAKFDGDDVKLGDAKYKGLRESPDMDTWIRAVTTFVNGLSPGTLILPTKHVSEKVDI